MKAFPCEDVKVLHENPQIIQPHNKKRERKIVSYLKQSLSLHLDIIEKKAYSIWSDRPL